MKCTHCTNEIKPIVCLDIDGTLANYHGEFLRFAVRWLGFHDDSRAMLYSGDQPLHRWLDITPELYRQVKLAFRQGGHKRFMEAFPGAASLTRRLRGNGAEVWLTTTRPYLRLDNVDPDTREWCNRHAVEYDYLFYDENKYERLLEQVDYDRVVCVVDDEAEQIKLAHELGISAVWRRTPYNNRMAAPYLTQAEGVGLQVQASTLEDVYKVVSTLVYNWRTKHEHDSRDRQNT